MTGRPSTHGPRSRRVGWILLLVHGFIIQMVAFSIRPAATYRALEQGMPPAVLGLLSAAYALAPLLLAVPVGRLIDRRGERWSLITGGLLLTGAAILMWRAPEGAQWLVAALAAFGVAHLVCVVAEQTVVGGFGRDGDSTSAFSNYTLVTSLGQAVGPLLLVVGNTRAGTPDLSVVLAVTTALAIAATLVGCFLGEHRRGPDSRTAGGRTSLQLLSDRRLRSAIIVSGVVMAVIDILLVYLPALATDRGYSAALVGVVLSARALSSMVIRVAAPRIVALAGRRYALAIGIGTAAAGLLALVAVPSPVALMAAAILIGAGLGLSQPLTMSMVSDLAPPNSRALAMSLRISGNRLGVLVLPASIGLIFGGAGAGAVLTASASVLGVAVAATLRAPEKSR